MSIRAQRRLNFCAVHLSVLVASAAAPPLLADEPVPRLVLLLTIDQGRGDYLERFGPVLSGGLGRLAKEGVVFTQAHHFHANTVTAAGHASLSTGRHPSRSGMIGNEWFDRESGRQVYCVEDPAHPVLRPPEVDALSAAGRSPRNLLVDGLADWVKRRHEGAKVISIGGKDRSAVIMGARDADAAYWYDRLNGHWITSRFYMDRYPEWVDDVHRARLVDDSFGTLWTPLDVSDAVLDGMEVERGGFAHALGPARTYRDRRFYTGIYDSPFVETLLFDFARRAVREEELGQDAVPDVLALSFASVDTVGHSYGPNSREVVDTVMRLDRELGAFLDFIDEVVGLDHVAISLSADHGVATLPEHQRAEGASGSRATGAELACAQRAGRRVEEAFGRGDWFLAPTYLNLETVASKGRSPSEVEALLANELALCPAVDNVWTRSDMETEASVAAEPVLTLFRHSYHPARSGDLFLRRESGHLMQARGTTHGSSHAYDTHVVTVVRWPGLAPRTVTEVIHTVDLPVTLARLMGITPPDDVDGVDRSGLMH